MKVSLRYVHEYCDQHGKMRRYYRRPGQPKVALPGKPGSPEFLAAYQAASSGHKIERQPIGLNRSPVGSIGAAIAAYYQNSSFLTLAPGTRATIHTWSEDEIALFEAAHPIGTRGRLAMALLLYTAARRGDAVLFGRQHTSTGRLLYRQQKTGGRLSIPIHPVLAEIIAATPTENLTFLVTPRGNPYTAAGFGHAMRKWCDEAGLPQCSAHGLRKAQARRLAEAGCSTHEIASITGHKTLAEVQRYSDAADQSRLADAAISRTSIGSSKKLWAKSTKNPK